jgi:chromosome partitioning protein
MMRLMVGNQRGGVGKTTTALNLARCFADRGLRTLLVDADPQGSISSVLKLRPEFYLADFLLKQLHLRDCVLKVSDKLDVLCGGRTTTDAEQQVTSVVARERLFEDLFTNFDDVYDAVLIDVAPSISLMQACAMVYARHFLIPVAMDSLSVSGAGASLFYASTISRACRVPIKPIALLPTIVNKRIGLTEVVMNMIHALGQQNEIPIIGPIRTDTAVGKAHRAHQFLADFDSKSKALEDYEIVADQILETFQVRIPQPVAAPVQGLPGPIAEPTRETGILHDEAKQTSSFS